jgi:hypothetical protein
MVGCNTERRINGVLTRIRIKLDTHDPDRGTSPEETIRSVGKMINSLDKLIYDSNYYGKNIPEINQIVEVKKMLKDVGVVYDILHIEHIKHKIDSIVPTKRSMLRLSFCQ